MKKRTLIKMAVFVIVCMLISDSLYLMHHYITKSKQNTSTEKKLTFEEQHYGAIASSSVAGTELEAFSVSESEYLEKCSVSAGEVTYTMEQLQQRFPSGRYWNGGNVDGTTGLPCNHSAGLSGCNAYGGCFYQCIGYAMKLSSLYTGKNPLSYNLYAGSGAVDYIQPGSVIRFNYNSWTDHGIMCTGISGNTYYFTDCNSDNQCGIRWGASYTKSQLQSLLERPLIQRWDYGGRQSDIGFVLTVNENMKSIDNCDITVIGPDLLRDESKPTVTLRYQGNELTANDYWYFVNSETNIDGTVIIEGRGDFEGQKIVSFDKIFGQISECTAVYENDSPYGTDPEVILINKYGQTVPKSEYKIFYGSSYSAGEKNMTISASNYSAKYRGSGTFAYITGKLDITGEKVQIKVDSTAKLVDGEAEVYIRITNMYTYKELEEGKDYTLTYYNNTFKTNNASVVITGIGDYCGETKAAFKVIVNNDLKIHDEELE